jgi:hypothetical protein
MIQAGSQAVDERKRDPLAPEQRRLSASDLWRLERPQLGPSFGRGREANLGHSPGPVRLPKADDLRS